MDRALHRFLRITKFLVCLIGQWPYQSIAEKIFAQVIFVPFIAGQAILQAGGVLCAACAGDVDAFMEGISPFVISLSCICKYVNFICNREQVSLRSLDPSIPRTSCSLLRRFQMKSLLETVQDDWKIYSRHQEEREILRRKYDLARGAVVSYAVSLYGSMTPFLSVPVMINIADALGYYNVTGNRPLMFRTEHFIDGEDYYWPLLIHNILGTWGFVTIVVGCDGLYLFYVQHGCGMCEILEYRLKHLLEDKGPAVEFYADKERDVGYRNAKECVKIHRHIIRFGGALEDAHTVSCFFQLGFNMLGMTFTAYQAVAAMQTPRESLRYASFAVCLTSVLLLVSWPGQELLEHTDRIFEYAYDAKWYQSSTHTRKIIHVMLTKSIRPVRLTAGKLYVLNLQNFAAVVRTCFSYFTVLCSVQ
ncbi:hypothetical protein KM043_003271 [Ampulex compressa]|nr:hypothetical protein KM043_003271 [Ampulex compressa]